MVNHDLLGIEGELAWNGLAVNGSKVRTGVYIFYAELVHPQGQVKRYKEVFLRFVKINFCRSCIGSRKRIIKIEKYVISSILYGYFYNGGRFLDIPVYPSW